MTTDIRRGATSASNAPADALCAGRHVAQKGIPESESSGAAFGREIHDALKTRDTSKLNTEQLDIFESCDEIEQMLIGQIFGNELHKIKTFREERYWCMVTGEDTIFADNSGPSPTREHKVKVKYEHSGQPDVVHRHLMRGLVIEFKTLPGEVAASPTNLQVRDQVVLASGHLLLGEVFAAVVQPLVTHKPEIVLYSQKDIAQAEKEMFERIRASNNPDSLRTAGEVQCKFCRAKGVCKEYLAWASALVPQRDSPLLLDMPSWSLEQRSVVAEHIPRLRKLLDDSENFLKLCLQSDPASVPGFYLKDGKFRSPITNPQELFNRFAEAGGTLEQFIECVKVGKGDLEDKLREVTKAKGKQLKAALDKMLEGIVDEKQDAPSLAKKKSG